MKEEGNGQGITRCDKSAVSWQGKDRPRAKGKADEEASKGQMMQGGHTRCPCTLQLFQMHAKPTFVALGAPSARASGSSLDLAKLTLARPSVSNTTMTLPVSPCALAFSPVRTACMHSRQGVITICQMMGFSAGTASQLACPLHV